jgi:hypothetical protein
MSSRNVGPCTYSMAMKMSAPLMPKSCSLTTCGLSIDATAKTSRRKRSMISASPTKPSLRILSAASRPDVFSRAR